MRRIGARSARKPRTGEIRGPALAALFLSGCILGPCQQNQGPPPPDRCNSPSMGMVSSLEIGPGLDDNASFSPWKDGDVVHIVEGGQGAKMTAVRMRLSGPDVPACIAQTTTFTWLDGTNPATNDVPLSTYPEGIGRTTHGLWIPAYFPGPGYSMVIHVDAAGLSVERTLAIEETSGADLAVPGIDLAPGDLRPPYDLTGPD
jgi:hypothetical protein